MLNKILVTGAAGFIGFHLANRLLKEDWEVVGIDNLNDYYDVDLKNARLDILQKSENFNFHKVSLEDKEEVKKVFEIEKPEYVVNLAAQAGVRYSLTNPHAYTSSNIEGFLNILEGCRHNGVKHLIYASSSSVYGANKNMPFSVGDNVDHPVSLYAATKKANELMAHTYSHLYNIPTTGLRFFTVYGPWGRPDMALFLFTKAILEEKPIDVFNHGMMKRDFTYIDDIVEGIYRLINHIPKPNNSWDALNPDPSFSKAPYKVFNIGNNQPVELNYFIESIEKALGKKAIKNLLPLQPGDVVETYANVDHLKDEVGFKPNTKIEDGIQSFVDWYRDYYKI
ncbi:MAG: NAD-dependent epimerase [Cyclobacteriaceae bacterium]|nr:NAD-dependent epimerase [Cyclobacteriaceae bacterium]